MLVKSDLGRQIICKTRIHLIFIEKWQVILNFRNHGIYHWYYGKVVFMCSEFSPYYPISAARCSFMSSKLLVVEECGKLLGIYSHFWAASMIIYIGIIHFLDVNFKNLSEFNWFFIPIWRCICNDGPSVFENKIKLINKHLIQGR